MTKTPTEEPENSKYHAFGSHLSGLITAAPLVQW